MGLSLYRWLSWRRLVGYFSIMTLEILMRGVLYLEIFSGVEMNLLISNLDLDILGGIELRCGLRLAYKSFSCFDELAFSTLSSSMVMTVR